MTKAIYFDMDGTIADLYGVENWLDYLEKEDAYPYIAAKPLISMSLLARYLNKLHKQGYHIGVISWTSKGGSQEYNSCVELAKKQWLANHLKSVKFDDIMIVPYGTPKSQVASIKNGILFDDNLDVRTEWYNSGGVPFDEEIIIPILKGLV